MRILYVHGWYIKQPMHLLFIWYIIGTLIVILVFRFRISIDLRSVHLESVSEFCHDDSKIFFWCFGSGLIRVQI
jgi:hypothetical protein